MATGEDKQESALDLASDCAYIRALDVSGKSIRISKADMAELIRQEMPVATIEHNGLVPSGQLLLASLELEPNQSIEIGGQRLVYINIRNGAYMALVSFSYWDYLVICGSPLDHSISIVLKSGNLFEITNISGLKIAFGYCIITKVY